MPTRRQQAVINTLEPGDLILVTSTPEYWSELLLVTKITPNGTVHVWGPEFSLNDAPGTWNISGTQCYYNPLSKTKHHPLDTDEYSPHLSQRADWDDSGVSDRKKLQPLSPNEVIYPNPSGPEAMRLYWGRCPYIYCEDHMVCGGCGGVEYPELMMGRVCGREICCPACMGYEFAAADRKRLEELEELEGSSAQVQEVATRRRCDKIDARRARLGYPRIIWE